MQRTAMSVLAVAAALAGCLDGEAHSTERADAPPATAAKGASIEPLARTEPTVEIDGDALASAPRAALPEPLQDRYLYLSLRAGPAHAGYDDVEDFEILAGARWLEIRASTDLNASRFIVSGPEGVELVGPPTVAMEWPPPGVWTIRVDQDWIAARSFEIDVRY